MKIDFNILNKNTTSAANNITEEAEEEFWYQYNNKPQKNSPFVTREELSGIVMDIVLEILKPIKEDIDKIGKRFDKLNSYERELRELDRDFNNLKSKVDEIYLPIKRENQRAAAARLSVWDDNHFEDINNQLPSIFEEE